MHKEFTVAVIHRVPELPVNPVAIGRYVVEVPVRGGGADVAPLYAECQGTEDAGLSPMLSLYTGLPHGKDHEKC